MKKSIYNIESEYLALVESIEENGGEVNEEIQHALLINKEEMELKAAQYAFVVKDLLGDVDIIDTEIKRLSELKKVKNKIVDRLKSTVSEAMKLYGIEKISLPSLKIFFKEAKSVSILDESIIPDEYKKTEVVVSVKKADISAAIKEGKEVPGAILVSNDHIQFK